MDREKVIKALREHKAKGKAAVKQCPICRAYHFDMSNDDEKCEICANVVE